MLTKDTILAAKDLPTETHPVPEWGGDVVMSTLTAYDKDAWEMGMSKENYANFRARLLVLVVVDEGGKRIFADSDAEALGGKNGLVVSRLFEVARRMNGFSDTDVEEMEKNSSSSPGGDSTSA